MPPAGERLPTKVAALCERFGTRVQYSVFECRLGEAGVQKLINERDEVIDPRVDSVRIYRFVGPLTAAILGQGATRNLDDRRIL